MRRSFRQITKAVAAQEVLEAIKKLMRNKAVGVDKMRADLIISGKVILAGANPDCFVL
jgi:hypothetical protein